MSEALLRMFVSRSRNTAVTDVDIALFSRHRLAVPFFYGLFYHRSKFCLIADAHRDERRFVVPSDEKLTTFVELERAIHQFAADLMS